MKKLTRDRVVPIISARVSWVICGMHCFRLARLAEFRHQQQNSRQALFAGVEELIDQVGLNAHAALQQELQEEVGETMLLVHDADHLSPADLESGAVAVMAVAVAKRSPRHRRERLFAHKVTGGEQRDGGFPSRAAKQR